MYGERNCRRINIDTVSPRAEGHLRSELRRAAPTYTSWRYSGSGAYTCLRLRVLAPGCSYERLILSTAADLR